MLYVSSAPRIPAVLCETLHSVFMVRIVQLHCMYNNYGYKSIHLNNRKSEKQKCDNKCSACSYCICPCALSSAAVCRLWCVISQRVIHGPWMVVSNSSVTTPIDSSCILFLSFDAISLHHLDTFYGFSYYGHIPFIVAIATATVPPTQYSNYSTCYLLREQKIYRFQIW